jgi:hypothetical protein
MFGQTWVDSDIDKYLSLADAQKGRMSSKAIQNVLNHSDTPNQSATTLLCDLQLRRCVL